MIENKGLDAHHILVVDDEPDIVEVVELYLSRSGYRVTVALDGQAAIDALTNELPDLVVLDLMLPKIDGLEITRRLRAEGNTPIIMLTSRNEEMDRILGLELGADDYMVKPFSPQELVSRVRAVLRRTYGTSEDTTDESSPLNFNGLIINPTTRLVHVDQDEVVLTAKEFDLLWMLANRPRQVFNRNQILENVWGRADYIDSSTVTVHVRRLREKIERDSTEPKHIHTVWGVGYKFEP